MAVVRVSRGHSEDCSESELLRPHRALQDSAALRHKLAVAAAALENALAALADLSRALTAIKEPPPSQSPEWQGAGFTKTRKRVPFPPDEA